MRMSPSLAAWQHPPAARPLPCFAHSLLGVNGRHLVQPSVAQCSAMPATTSICAGRGVVVVPAEACSASGNQPNIPANTLTPSRLALPGRAVSASTHQTVAVGVHPPGAEAAGLPEAVRALWPHHFPTVSAARKSCRRGEFAIGGHTQRNRRLVQPGEAIEWRQRTVGFSAAADPHPDKVLEVVYEDDDLACVIKPQGLPVQGRDGRPGVNLYAMQSLTPSQALGVLWKPHYVHRLDEPTGGLLLIAKSRAGMHGLSTAFAQRRVGKRYRALVWGRLEGGGSMEAPLDGKPSVTRYRALQHSRAPGRPAWVTTVDLFPETGRMHQLRRHMALIGHPVLGDLQYTYGYAKQREDAFRQRAELLDAQDGSSSPCGLDAADDRELAAGKASSTSQAAGPSKRPADGVSMTKLASYREAAPCLQATADRASLPDKMLYVSPPPPERLRLWALELSLRHPVRDEVLHLVIPEPPDYEAERAVQLKYWHLQEAAS